MSLFQNGTYGIDLYFIGRNMKLEYNDKKLGCFDFLILLIIVGVLILGVYLSYDCYTAPTIQEAPGYCLMLSR